MKSKKSIITKVEKGLKVALENKMNSYKRETTYMPFMEGIFGKKILPYIHLEFLLQHGLDKIQKVDMKK